MADENGFYASFMPKSFEEYNWNAFHMLNNSKLKGALVINNDKFSDLKNIVWKKTDWQSELTNNINSIDKLKNYREAGITVNNQAVFLKGINDSAEDIEALMNGLVRIGINPYYLYQCMPVSRVRHHFQVPLKYGIDIVDKAKTRLDGYAKRFKFIMGHDIGKIEVCGRIDNKLILKQIHSRPEEPEKGSRMMVMQLDDKAGWLNDMQELAL